MELQLVSDLHMEFSDIEIPKAADILVLSGDICVISYLSATENSPYYAKGQRMLAFFEGIAAKFTRIYYVLGNHEFYRGYLDTSIHVLRAKLAHLPNIVILDNQFDDYEGFRFIGATLWTDMWGSPIYASMVEDGLNDYRLIKVVNKNYRKMIASDTIERHHQSKKFIEDNIIENTIVLGHHGPSERSITPQFATGPYSNLNPGYVSHLDGFILGNPQIKLWTHGHVHSSHDYYIGATRIAANPRGYNTENSNFNPELVIEL